MLLRVAVLTSLLAGSAWAQGNAPPSAPPDPSQSVGGVYNELAPHGRWLYSSDYGWVWTPNQQVVGNDFVPYASNGHWVYSDAGWMFESGYPWGWLAFHYGRWDYGQFGWIWIPGFVWGPAWVDWRYGNGYVGWAPLLPRLRARRMHHWFFVRANHFTHRRVRRYFVGRHATRRLLTVAPPIRAMVVRGNFG